MTTTTNTTPAASSVTNPADEAVLADIARGLAAGEDVFGDDEPLVRESIGGTADTSPAEAGANAGATTTDDDLDTDTDTQDTTTPDATTEQQPAAGKGDEAGQPGAADDLDPTALEELADPLGLNTEPVRYQAEAPADLKEQRTALRAEKAAAFQKLMDGEIDAAAYAVEEDRIADSLEALNRQQVRAETLQEVNRQNDVTSSQKVIATLIRTTKAEVDYAADPKAIAQFDRALGLVVGDPDHARLSFKEQTDLAHKMVKALRGVTTAPAAASAPGAQPQQNGVPDRRPKEAAPITLRDMPNAAQAATGGGVIEQISQLTGQEYEAAFARLTPAQRASLLDGD